MPQTEEEHLIGLEEENESIEGQPTDSHHNTDPDAEVSLWTGWGQNKNCCQQGHCHGIMKLIICLPSKQTIVLFLVKAVNGLIDFH